MARTYPLGYAVGVYLERTADGPSGRLSFCPESEATPEVISGLLSYEALADVSALVFALLEEMKARPADIDPF